MQTLLEKEGLILGRVPVGNDSLIQIGLNVGAQVEQVSLLGPDGQKGATALEDIRRGTGLHIGQHLVFQVIRVGGVEDPDIGMISMERFQHLLDHRGKPVCPPVLVDQLHFLGAFRYGGGSGRGAGIQGRAGHGPPRQLQESSPGECG